MDCLHRQRRERLAGYLIERCQGAGCSTFLQIARPVTNSDSDPGLTAGTSYSYRVRAVDGAGNLSLNYSNTGSATPPAVTTLVTAYGMNEGTGTTLADASETGHPGTLVNGPAWVAGQPTYGQALSFDGINDAVSVANPASFNFGTADFTIELWAKRNVLGGAQRHLFSKCDSTLWQSGCKEFYFNASNQLTFDSFATGNIVSSTIADTNWHHVAVTFTDSTNTLNMYVDGALVTTATTALEADGAGHVVTLGNLIGSNPFSGLLDEVRIYSRTLTLAEIQADRTTPITPPDTTPPSTVTGLTATAISATQINLSWTAATDNVGVTGYRVERCQGTGCTSFVQIATLTGTTFGDTGLVAATPYSYRVKAIDAATNVSVNYSTVANATTQALPDTTPPSTVTGLTATAVSATQINLSWTAATDNVGVTGYRVERCQGAGCTSFVQIATPSTNSVSNSGLTAGTRYSYRVKAIDAATNVSVNYSTVATATTQALPDTTPPSTVTGLTATAVSATQINLSWTAATDNVGVTGYRVERCQGAGCTSFVQIATPSTNSVSNPGLTAGTRYSYRVKAIDAATNVSVNYSTVATATTQALPDTTPPSTVTGLTATAVSATQINLSWTAATDNVGVTGYSVERCQGAGCTSFVQIATPSTNSVSNPGLTAGTRYSYRVKAIDAATNVSVNYSTVATATTQALPDTTPPSTVTGLTATAVSATQINLSWTAATDNVGVTGYSVERCQGAGCTSFVQIATPSTNSVSNPGLTAGTRYSYRVKAIDAATNVSVNYSTVANATTLSPPDTTPPTAPGTPTAKPSGKTQIHLKWLAATDNVGVTGYRVERCAGTACNNFVEVDQPTHTNVHDTGLTASTTYHYRVRAIDAAGNLGPYSGISTATTEGHPTKGNESPGHHPDERGRDGTGHSDRSIS